MERTFEKAKDTDKAAMGQQNWTIALDLAIQMHDLNGKPSSGASHSLEQIKSFAAETKGSGVSLVVSIPRIDEARTVHEKQKPHSKSKKDDLAVDTFLIRDGNYRLLGSHQSQQAPQDLTNLLKTAEKIAPSKNLGLIVFAHGSGNVNGVQTDLGTINMSQLHDSIKRGLHDHQELGVLDFDTCLMSSTDTVHSLHDVTEHLVASADIETGDTRYGINGQNFIPIFRDLIAHPTMKAKELAHDFILKASEGFNDGDHSPAQSADSQYFPGTATLAALDMSKNDPLDKNLEILGHSLRKVIATESGLSAVTDAISGATFFPTNSPSFKATQRDTKQFAQNILDEVQQGRISDDGDIRRAAEGIIAAQTSLIEDVYTDSRWQGKTAGLTTYLPDVSAKAQQDARISHVPLGMLEDNVNRYTSIENKHFILNQYDTQIAITKVNQPTMSNQLFENLDRAVIEVAISDSELTYAKSLTELKAAAEVALQSPEMQIEISREEPVDYKFATEPNDSEWHRFANELVERGVYHASEIGSQVHSNF